MHPFSILTVSIFVAGYITARWDLVTRLYELALFAVDHGVVTRTAKGFAILSVFFFLFVLPVERLAARETALTGSLLASNFDVAAPFRKLEDDIMVANHGLLRVFWPSDAPKTKRPGTIVGWRNTDLDVFVVAILHDAEAYKVENAFRIGTLFRNSPYPVIQLLRLCKQQSMHVLGTVNASPQPGTSQPHRLAAVTDPASRFPQIWSLAESSVTVQIIMYDRPLPSRMQYMSLSPISLALGDKHMAGSVATPFSHTKSPLPIDPRRQYLLSKLQQHTVVRHAPGEKELMLAVILSQINCSFEMMQLLSRNAFLLGARQKRSVSLSDRVVESATTLWQMALYLLWRVWTVWIYPYLTQGFIYGLICHRIVAELVLRVLEWQPPRCRMALKDVSATAQQFDIRLQQFCYWPIQYSTLRKRRTDWESVTDKHPDYIRFYNSLWLVANDIIIGIALGSYIIENAYWVAYQINTVLSIWTIAGLRSMIFWLMDWPAGLKLNTELAHFLGHLSRWIIHYWAECVDHLKPFLPHVIYLIGFSAFAGATMPISLFSDLLSLLTIHIYCFYAASARIFHWQLSIIVSLFHLFRGKKHNVLRNRIDSCDYDLDQLLLGTILFTLLFFLLPTVAVFYLTFTAARIIIISLKAVLDIALACLNHFPLFALMLRVKDPRRLPGGISFELQQSPTLPSPFHVKGKSPAPTPSSTTANGSPLSPSSSLPVVPPAPPPTSLILLRSVPLSLRAILDQYFQLAARLREHYISPRVFMDLATGGFLPPIERRNLYSLQYSMLPARRPGVGEVWKALWDDDGSGGGESGGGGGDVGRWGDNGKGERGEVGHEWARNGDLAKR